jgi:hypothetical protein
MDKLKELLLELLKYIGESPFRLFTVILLCILGFGGWIVYSEKDAFMASYRAQQALPHMNGKYEEAASFILKNSQAELIAIFEVNTLLNTRKLVYFATRKSGQEKSMYGTDVGLLTKNYDNNNDVISMMSGKVPCQTYEKPQSLMGFIYVEKGVKWMCRISVPAEPGIFIGQISVGWSDVPIDKILVDTQQTVMTVASSLLYNKK